MRMIQADCRGRLTEQDTRFIVSVLGTGASNSVALESLLRDQTMRDLILDHPKLAHAVMEAPACMQVSPQLYFYLFVRRELRRRGVEEREVADYVAELLAEFTEIGRVSNPIPDRYFETDYLVDLLNAMQGSPAAERFRIQAHVGNYALFMTGLYPERIAFRQRYRGAPGFRYYERMGSAYFRAASDWPYAWELDVHGVYRTISERFHELRLALNVVADGLFFLGEPFINYDALAIAPTS